MQPPVEIVSRFETLEGPHPRATRVRLEGPRIGAVDGRGREVGGSPTRAFDLRDFHVIPAFVDAHVHLVMAGLSLRQLDLSDVTGRRSFEQAIAKAAARLAAESSAEGAWLEAWGWSAERWASEGGAAPDRSWLAAAGNRPAIAWRMDRHACVLNDAALRIVESAHAGLPALPGGEVARDAEGRPTGLFVEANAWKQVMPLVPPADPRRRRLAVREAAAHLFRRGVAAVGSMEYASEIRESLIPVAADGADPLRLRIAATILDRSWPVDPALGTALTRELEDAGAAETLRVIGFKAFADGTLGLRTARMLEDYADRPGDRGMLVELALEGHLDAWAERVWNAGFSPSIHAIGDEAFRRSLDAFEKLPAHGGPPRIPPRIEHGQTVHIDDLPRVRGRTLSMQPLHRVEDARPFERAMGRGRLDRFFRFRSLLDHGATLAFGSDWPIVEPDAIAAMRSAITGRIADGSVFHDSETITPREALAAHTRQAARCVGFDDAGTIAPGRRADLVVLDRDPLACDWHREPPQVVATIVGGAPVFDPQGLLAT